MPKTCFLFLLPRFNLSIKCPTLPRYSYNVHNCFQCFLSQKPLNIINIFSHLPQIIWTVPKVPPNIFCFSNISSKVFIGFHYLFNDFPLLPQWFGRQPQKLPSRIIYSQHKLSKQTWSLSSSSIPLKALQITYKATLRGRSQTFKGRLKKPYFFISMVVYLNF